MLLSRVLDLEKPTPIPHDEGVRLDFAGNELTSISPAYELGMYRGYIMVVPMVSKRYVR